MELLDMNRGQLSYQGLDLLCQLEINGNSFVSNAIIINLALKGYKLDKLARVWPVKCMKSMNGQQLSSRNDVTPMEIKVVDCYMVSWIITMYKLVIIAFLCKWLSYTNGMLG
jgi:hypothetical protein